MSTNTPTIPGTYPPGYNSPNYHSPHHDFTQHPLIPGPAICQRSYTIQAGDSLHNISYRFGIPAKSLTAANATINFTVPLIPGQVLCLPYR